MTTIVDVAKKAGVSPAAVSCVLNARTSAIAISKKTKARVLQAVADLGYRRDEIARAMISGRLSMIGVSVPSVNSEVVGAILEGILDVAEEFNYFIKVLRVGKRSGGEIARLCLQYRLAGMVCSQLPDAAIDEIYRGLNPHHVPLVVADNSAMAPWKIRVLSDDQGGVHQALEHFKTLGHRHIGFCASNPRSPWSIQRRQGFISAMEALGLSVNPKWIFQNVTIDGDLSQVIRHFKNAGSHPASLRSFAETGPASLRSFAGTSPTALLCAGDPLAMVLIRALRGIGLKVPRDVSIIGFADVASSLWCDPPLTTVHQPFREMGAAAMRRLMALILNPSEASKNTNMTEVLPAPLVVRGSTGKPHGESSSHKQKGNRDK